MSEKLLLDTNLSLLFAVGLTRRSYIAAHKRLRSFDEKDFEAVSEIISMSSGVVFSPNVLSETSNLLRYIESPAREEISYVFSELIKRTEELFVESHIAVNRPEYSRLGLTDAVLLKLAEGGGVVLTVDSDLCVAAESSGLKAVNYNHIRDKRPDFR